MEGVVTIQPIQTDSSIWNNATLSNSGSAKINGNEVPSAGGKYFSIFSRAKMGLNSFLAYPNLS